MKIHWKLVLVILAFELLVGLSDAMSVLHCHQTVGAECWPWFGIFSINLPASVGPALLLGATSIHLGFYSQWVLAFVSYVAIGTLWWAAMLHLVIWLVAKVSGKLGRKNV